MLLYESNLDEKEGQQYFIGICGLAGCTVPSDIDDLFDRLRPLDSAQTVVALQLFDSDTIATHLHVLVSALYALRAFHIGKSISNSLGTEVLLYASAQHQIVDAINRIGLKPESLGVAAVAISLSEDAASQALAVAMKELAGQMDDNVLNIRSVRKERAIKTVFGITEEELNATGMGTDLKDVERAITRRVLSRISIMAVSK